MLHDETIYPDPFSFKPERFLKSGKINKEVRDPIHMAFGFGRRSVTNKRYPRKKSETDFCITDYALGGTWPFLQFGLQ